MTQTKKAILLSGGKVIDPSQKYSAPGDLLIEGGKIKALGKPGSFGQARDFTLIDVTGLLVVPGLIDVHVHLREPGFEWKETIATGAQAAIAGGFSAICCMPNTNPVNDTAQVSRFILEQAEAAGKARVYPIGAITKGSKGEILAPLVELREAGCVAFSDDGHPVANSLMMRKALEYNKLTGTVLAVHEEDTSLAHGGAMNESAIGLKLGLKGMPGAAEDIMVARDIELARMTGSPVHFCHISTARAVKLIKRAKEDGIPVTAEATPHHFTLSDKECEGYNTLAKMNPPLRSEQDREAIVEGLASGVIDCIVSDHAPHEADSKNKEFVEASFGIIGLQTTLPLTLALVRSGKLSMERAIEALSSAPARLFGLPGGTLKVGAAADITLIDTEHSWTLAEDMLLSKSKNSPFLGWQLKGVAVRTFVGGEELFSLSSPGN